MSGEILRDLASVLRKIRSAYRPSCLNLPPFTGRTGTLWAYLCFFLIPVDINPTRFKVMLSERVELTLRLLSVAIID